MNYGILFLILTTFLGAGIGLYFKPKTPLGTKLILAFSGSFLLAILVLEMIPSIYKSPVGNPGIWILVGLLFQLLLELFSKGAEHGHIHTENGSSRLLPLFLSLGAHAFLEGLPLLDNTALMWAVAIHKIPIALVVTLLVWKSKYSLTAKGILLVLFSLFSPLGAWAGLFLDTDLMHRTVEPLVVGILLHISTTILFESTEGHVFHLQKFLAIISGIGVAFLF